MMPGVLTFGETMALVRAADLGAWDTVSRAAVSIGGADSNVAIGLARLGVRSTWIGRVGPDSLGQRVVRELRAEGVTVRAIVDSAPTGLMLKERRTPTHTRVTFYRSGSAGSHLCADDITDQDIEQAEVVLVNGVTASLSDGARDAVLSVVQRARRAAVTVAFDVNHRPSLWIHRDPRALYSEIASNADIVFAGDDEARLITGSVAGGTEALAAAVSSLGPREVVMKNGAAGAIGLVSGEFAHEPAVRIDPVDTVGAGDAFVAGYLAARLAKVSAADCLKLAVQCGAFACLGPGDWESLPRPNDLALLMAVDPVQR